MTFVDPLRTTASAFMPARLAEAPSRRAFQLFLEAYLSTLFACALLLLLGLDEGGLVSIFLASAPLTDRLVTLLEENRQAIYTVHVSSRQANQRTAAGVLFLFVGMAVGYATVGFWLGESETLRVFAFAMRTARVDDADLMQRAFGSFSTLVDNNIRVALVVFCLGFVYRTYGAMLALAWNACVWTSVIVVLLLRVGTQMLAARVLLTVALVPHIIIEASAYVLIALGAIFASKALATHEVRHADFRTALRAATVLVAIGIGGLVVAAFWESWALPLLLSVISRH